MTICGKPIDNTSDSSNSDLSQLPDGSPSNPIIAFANDSDTGLYRSSTNELSITSGGNQQFSVNTTNTVVKSDFYVGESNLIQPRPNEWVSAVGVPENVWVSLAYAPEINTYVCVGRGLFGIPVSNNVLYSTDATTWTTRTATDSTYTDVVWAPELTLFCSIGTSGSTQVSTSANGITWVSRTAGSNALWSSICWAPELTLFVAVAPSGPNRIMTSPNGVSWTTRTASLNVWNSVCWSPELTLFVAVGQATASPSSAGVVMTSSNGLTWNDETSIPQGRWSCVVYGSDKFVALGVDGSVMTSTNGESWVLGSQPSGSLIFRDVIYVPSIKEFMGLSGSAVASSSITSKDGLNWIADADSPTLLWNKVVYNVRESMYVAVSLNGAFSQIMTKRYGVSIATKTSIPYLTTSNLQSNFGSLTEPSYTFTGDSDTGLYRPSTNSIGFTAGGINSVAISPTGIRIVDGDASNPSLTFINDTDTGLARPSANTLALVSNGVSSLNITPTGFNSSVQPLFYVKPAASFDLSVSTNTNTYLDGDFWDTPSIVRGVTYSDGEVTIVETGIYQVSLSITFEVNTVGARASRCDVITSSSVGDFIAFSSIPTTVDNVTPNTSGSWVGSLTAGQVIAPLVFQKSGGSLDVGVINRNSFSIVRLF